MDAPRSDLLIRVNDGEAGGTQHMPVPSGDAWVFHPKPVPRVDVAALPISGDAGKKLLDMGCRWIPRTMLFSESELLENPNYGVGLSDEVLAIGLFTNHTGKERNEPILRTGNIAMIPTEPVATNPVFGPMQIYLVELRSIAGMSGSPVVVPHRVPIGQPQRPVSLLGVLLGHYDVDQADGTTAAVNMGIGMVAPARLLGEVLDDESLVKRRQVLDERAGRMDDQMPGQSD
jgi:hypothetical protein